MKRLPASLLLFLLFSSSVFASVIISAGNAEAQTNISGVISEDSVWTKTGSPYNFVGNVALSSGVKLTLEPGTIVNLNGYCFDVEGVFSAVGTVSDPVRIIGLGTTYGSDVNRIKFSGSNTITVIENCNIKMALIQVEGVSLKITNNDLTSVYISLFSIPTGGQYAPIISNNVFTGGVGIGIAVNSATTIKAAITNNIINNLNSQLYGATGINIQSGGTDLSIIEGNFIRGAEFGIRIMRGSNATIRNNFITENLQGISFLYHTLYPPQTNAIPSIFDNNIYGNFYNVFSNRSIELDATGNWWGTNNTQEVSKSIHFENSNLGAVHYLPFLATPNLQAPPYVSVSVGIGGLTPFPLPTYVISPVPTPTVTPTPSPTPNPSPSVSPSVTPLPTPLFSPTPIPSPTVTPTSTPNPTPEPNISPTLAPTQTPTITPTPTPTANPNATTLIVSCISSTSYSGFNVAIKGNLVRNGTALSNAPVLLSYSINGGKSYQDLTLVNTAYDGSFSASWMPSVTGNYLVKATFEEDTNFSGASTIVNLAVMQHDQQNIFSVSSNSSVSSLSFNSTSNELSFTVTGDSGTFGVADVFIAKDLVHDASSIKVYLDDNNLNCNVLSVEDAWLLHFTYSHSSHKVVVNINSAINQTNDSSENWLIFAAFTLIAVALIAGTFLVLKIRKTKQVTVRSEKR
jgi:hypothetical protein